MGKTNNYTVWFSEIGKNDINLAGGKGANLGEMTKARFPVPNGFIITSDAYKSFIDKNNLKDKISQQLRGIDYKNQSTLKSASENIKNVIKDGKIPHDIKQQIISSYKKLGEGLVAVRSSATAEDLPNASFAGQQETYLNVEGEKDLLDKVLKAWASLFEVRAIFYREEQKFDHFKVYIALPVQKMVASDKSGVMFSVDPISQDKNKIVVEAVYGLGEYIVQGTVTPDHFEVSKSNLKLIKKDISTQEIMFNKVGRENKSVEVEKSIQHLQKITDDQVLALAKLAVRLENHYKKPQDIEWAIEGDTIYIVQTRPITTLNENADVQKATQKLPEPILSGNPASPGFASGPVKILKSAKEIGKISIGDILVAPQTNPDFVPAMTKASGIVTDSGGRTSHAAIVSRELGIPAVVGAMGATERLKDGEIITVDGSSGNIYKGKISFEVKKKSSRNLKTKTHVYVNIAQPEVAPKVGKMGADGIGLLRAEFIMANIGTHPKKFIKMGKKSVFIKKLAENLEIFCKSFADKPVVYRANDFKSNEYRNLIGGKEFEPIESNPMLGYRGVFRYISEPDVFNMELEAIKLVRKKYKNLYLMLPFVRTVEDLILVNKLIADSGLKRSSEFKVWMMVEIPSNVILLEKFIEAGIDGVSIGSNDLTMLILGTDRDNNTVEKEFDETNEAVLWAIEKVIKTAKKYGITSSICGQAPSEFPDLVKKLVNWGITSISVSPDAIDKVRENIYEVENPK